MDQIGGYSADEMVGIAIDKRSFVIVDETMITVNVAYPYEIPRLQCNTPAKVLNLVAHLCEKDWITPSVLQEFIYKASASGGFKILA